MTRATDSVIDTRPLYCSGSGQDVQARLTDGGEDARRVYAILKGIAA